VNSGYQETRKWCHLTGSVLDVAVKCRKLAYTVHFTYYKAVACSRRQSRDTKWLNIRWPEVTRKWRHLTGSHLQVAVEFRKLAYMVHFTSYKAVARSRRESCNRKWCHMTSRPGSDLEVMWFYQKSSGSGCKRPTTRVYGTFRFLQGCSSQ